MPTPVRTAIVGTGNRAQLFTEGLAKRDGYDVVALCDPNSVRMAFHNRMLLAAGRRTAHQWPPARFDEMLRVERIELLVVTSVDATHDRYIEAALRAGVRVISEKPMTTDATKAQSILDTVRETGGELAVAYNYRFNPVHRRVRELLAEGAIGDVHSVHFEWMLDVSHGADYFRRWHRDKANSGGLMVHKASHHFDLVNWWLGAEPRIVYAQGQLAFYGPEHSGTGTRGTTRGPMDPRPRSTIRSRCTSPTTRRCASSTWMPRPRTAIYRDRNVFAPGVSIEDDMAVLVSYDSGATMTLSPHRLFAGRGLSRDVQRLARPAGAECRRVDMDDAEPAGRVGQGSGPRRPRRTNGRSNQHHPQAALVTSCRSHRPP